MNIITQNQLDSIVEENIRLKLQNEILTQTIEAAKAALSEAPLWHHKLMDVSEILHQNNLRIFSNA